MRLSKRFADASHLVVEWLLYKVARVKNEYKLRHVDLARKIGITRGAITNYVNKRRVPCKTVIDKFIQLARSLKIKLKKCEFLYTSKNKSYYGKQIYDMKWNYVNNFFDDEEMNKDYKEVLEYFARNSKKFKTKKKGQHRYYDLREIGMYLK